MIHLLNDFAAGIQVHQAGNLLDWVKTTADAVKITILAVFNVVVLGGFVFMIIKAKLVLAQAVIAGIACALILWFGNAGILWLSGGIGATVGN